MATQGEPGCSQGTGESLAFTGGHLDNVSLHERQRALQLYIEGAHGQGALGDFAERGQKLRGISGVLAGEVGEVGVGKRLYLWLELSGACH